MTVDDLLDWDDYIYVAWQSGRRAGRRTRLCLLGVFSNLPACTHVCTDTTGSGKKRFGDIEDAFDELPDLLKDLNAEYRQLQTKSNKQGKGDPDTPEKPPQKRKKCYMNSNSVARSPAGSMRAEDSSNRFSAFDDKDVDGESYDGDGYSITSGRTVATVDWEAPGCTTGELLLLQRECPPSKFSELQHRLAAGATAATMSQEIFSWKLEDASIS